MTYTLFYIPKGSDFEYTEHIEAEDRQQAETEMLIRHLSKNRKKSYILGILILSTDDFSEASQKWEEITNKPLQNFYNSGECLLN